MLCLREVEKVVVDLSKRINTPSDLLPTFGYNEDFARPEVRVDKNGYHYVIVERGQEQEHLITRDMDDLLYWMFESVTHTMAFDYELKHRIENKDCRRIGFDKQLKLLALINIEFAKKREGEIKAILERSPFDDFASIRARL